MIFTTAKQNLIAKFKARFTFNSPGEDYIFYPTEYEQGFACSAVDYDKYVSDFRKFLKKGTRIMWLWLLVCIPFMLWLEILEGFEFTIFTGGMLFLIPYPFLVMKGVKIFNAPNALVKNTRSIKRPRNQKEIQNSRIKGMSWTMLNLLTIVPLLGIYVFLTNTSLHDWQVALSLCFFVTVSGFGIYLMIRKWKL